MGASAKPLRVLHVIESVGPASFGLGPVALNLVREQQARGLDARIWCVGNSVDAAWAAETAKVDVTSIVSFPTRGPAILRYSPAMERAVRTSEGRAADVIHQHGIWTGLSRVTNSWRRLTGNPTVIAPHGSLEAWARKRSAMRKRLALLAYEAKNLREAACLHATSGLEAEGFLAAGVRTPIAVVGNGIAPHWIQSSGNGAAFRSRFAILPSHRIMLYIGRVSPVKNLTMLVDALAELKDGLHAWQLVIAGKDEFDYRRLIEARVVVHGLDHFVRFVGPLSETEKRDAFDAAEIVVVPSLREASPIVVLEALGAGVPVLTTKGVPWREVESQGCGWWADVSVEGIAAAVRAATNTSPAVLRTMGHRGRAMVEDRHQWSHSAAKLTRLYTWLRSGGVQPDFMIGTACRR